MEIKKSIGIIEVVDHYVGHEIASRTIYLFGIPIFRKRIIETP